MSVSCRYAPQCTKMFARTFTMERHCRNVHGNKVLLYCNLCPTLKHFDTKKALSDHKRYHKKKACVHCDEEYSVPNLKRHQATCLDRPIEADENDAPTTPTPTPVNMEPLTKFPTRGLVLRSAHRAPSKESAEVVFADYLEWLRSPAALGRPQMKNPDAHFNKFRTLLGKMERHYEREYKELVSIIRSPSRCKLVFEPKLLDAFTRSLSSSDSNTKLTSRTVYQYIRALYLYLEWMVKVRGCSHLSMALELLGTTQTNLARVKEVEVDREGKAAHFTTLPSVPQFVAFIDKVLRPTAHRAFSSELATTWTKYKAYRDYMLVALLFLVPPQRLQVYERLDIRRVSHVDGCTILSVDDHKTAGKYGRVLIALPPSLKEDVDNYIECRSEWSDPSCHSFFVDGRRGPERNLTHRFKVLVGERFGPHVVVTIRDCRSLYVTHAQQHSTATEMHELSRRMYHSFETQQQEYRSITTVEEAISALAHSDALARTKV